MLHRDRMSPESLDPLPGASLDPTDWEAYRALAHRMVDLALDYQRDARERPAWRPYPEAFQERFREGIPREGRGTEAALQDFLELVHPFPVGTLHPRFWGWAGGTGSPTGMMAELLAASMNGPAGLFNDGPSRVEQQLVDWMKEAMGFPRDASGVTVSGGSMANLVGLAVGRDARAGWDVGEEGVAPGRLVLYASTEVHSSVPKAAKLLGLGRQGLRLVPVDGDFRIRLDVLDRMIREDRARGWVPFAVVGTAGTINTGAIDDLEGLAERAAREGLWFHVDGAFGAIAALSPELAPRLRGIERADSLAFDFHKWMHAPYEGGCVLVRDAAAHRRTFSVHADYLAPPTRGPGAWPGSTNLVSPQLSRGFKALKVWMVLKEQGVEAFGRMAARNVRQAVYLAGRIDASPHLERLAPVSLNVVAFRRRWPGASDEELDALNRELLMRIQERGIAVPSSTVLQGRFCLRACMCNQRTRRDDLDALVEALEAIGEEVAGEMGLGAGEGGNGVGPDGTARGTGARADADLRQATVEILRVHPEAPEALRCIERYFAELDRRLEGGFDPAGSLPAPSEQLLAPRGAFLVARLEGEAVGCGALLGDGSGVGSIKRMWVAAEARGQGLGRKILEALEEEARKLGIPVLRLETNRALHEARSLYRAAGFREVPPFNDDPYSHHWLEKVLAETPGGAGTVRATVTMGESEP